MKGFRDYADYMATPAFAHGVDELIRVADKRVPVIMCSEALPWRCHRRLISDALLVRGVDVENIMSGSLTSPAHLTSFARVDGDRITYPAGSGAPQTLF